MKKTYIAPYTCIKLLQIEGLLVTATNPFGEGTTPENGTGGPSGGGTGGTITGGNEGLSKHGTIDWDF